MDSLVFGSEKWRREFSGFGFLPEVAVLHRDSFCLVWWLGFALRGFFMADFFDFQLDGIGISWRLRFDIPKKGVPRVPSGRRIFSTIWRNPEIRFVLSCFPPSSNLLPNFLSYVRMNLPVHPVSFPCSRFLHQQSCLCPIQKAFLRLPKANLV